MLNFGAIQFRNGIYQGSNKSLSPQQVGIYFDDDLYFHCSHWKQSLMNNHTAILYSHAKYIYGEWKNGLPHGFNVFRTGENVVLAIFENGEIVGDFILIFQRQGYVIVANNHMDKNGRKVLDVVEKKQFKNEIQLKKIINNVLRKVALEEEHFSFVKYLNTNFSSDQGNIKLYFENGVYNFGYDNGLRVVFDDDICISRMGSIDEVDQMCGLGVMFDKITEIGNFANGLIIKYREGQKPVEEIKKLFKNEHKRSMNFRNDFMFTKSGDIVTYLESLMRSVIDIISENPVDTERTLVKEELNESMEYRPKPFELSEENQRLKIMKEELGRAIGMRGSIKPTFYDNKTPSKYSDDIKQLHLARAENQALSQPQGISFSKQNGKTKEQNRKSFVKDNKLEDYRDKNINMNKDKVVKGSRTQYEEPVLVGKAYNTKIDNRSSNKSYNNESNKSFNKSPSKNNMKYEIEKSPSRSYLPKESQVSTAHKDSKKYEIKQPAENHYKSSASNKKLNIKSLKVHEQLDDSLESPYRKHMVDDSIRENQSRKQTKNNSSREQYIPISHNKTVNAVRKSPQKSPEKKAKIEKEWRNYPPKQFVQEFEDQPKSYIALYKNSSPTSNQTQQKQKTSPAKKVAISPLKNPYYERDTKQEKPSHSPSRTSYVSSVPAPVVYTKEPIQYVNPYLKRSQAIEESRKISPERAKMLERISKKYNYKYDNL